MLIDKSRIRSIIHDYMQESPHTIQHVKLDVLTKRIWKYIEERVDETVFDMEALNLNILVAHPAWKRGFEVAISQAIGKLKGELKEEECPICHGKGATYDHHDPCSNCGGTGKLQ